MLPPIALLSHSPIQKLYFPFDEPPYSPFGSSTAANVLNHFLGTPDIATQVLFLYSGDLRNALYMATHCSDAYPELDIHLSDGSDSIVARNYLIAHVMLSDTFDPSSPTDLQYLWDLWYGLQWDDITRKRFVKDCKLLIGNQATNSYIIPHGADFNKKYIKILTIWLGTACNMNSTEIQTILGCRQMFILDTCTIQIKQIKEFPIRKFQNPQLNQVSLKQIRKAKAVSTGIYIDSPSQSIVNQRNLDVYCLDCYLYSHNRCPSLGPITDTMQNLMEVNFGKASGNMVHL